MCSSTQTQAPVHTPTSSHKLSPLLPLSLHLLWGQGFLSQLLPGYTSDSQSLGVSLTPLFFTLSHLTVIMALDRFWFCSNFIKTKLIFFTSFFSLAFYLLFCWIVKNVRLFNVPLMNANVVKVWGNIVALKLQVSPTLTLFLTEGEQKRYSEIYMYLLRYTLFFSQNIQLTIISMPLDRGGGNICKLPEEWLLLNNHDCIIPDGSNNPSTSLLYNCG